MVIGENVDEMVVAGTLEVLLRLIDGSSDPVALAAAFDAVASLCAHRTFPPLIFHFINL